MSDVMAGKLLVPATPTTYTLEVTTRCNSACLGCGNVFERTLGEMDLTGWQDLLAMLAPHIVSLRLTGGEPTLHLQFPDLLRSADQLGVPFVVFSNGLWPEGDGTLAALLACDHLDGVLISLHGRDATTHRAFAGIDSFGQVTCTIQQATQAGLSVNTNTVLTHRNYRDVEAIAARSHDLGAGFAAFSRYYGPATPATDLTDGEFRTAVAAIHSLQEQGARVHLNNCVPVCFHGLPTKSCPAGLTHCTVDPLGRVRPCTHAPQILGNLFEQSIEEIWQCTATTQWRASIPHACKSCAEFLRCRGGCKAMAYHQRQDRDPMMHQPLQQPLPTNGPSRIELYAGARVAPNFTLRKEKFGYLLINRNQIIPVRAQTKPLLDTFDGATTLGELKDSYGQTGLDFVAYLFQKGLVHLSQ